LAKLGRVRVFAIDLLHDLRDDRAVLQVFVAELFELFRRLLQLLLRVSVLLLLLRKLIGKELFLPVESGFLRCDLAVEHVHPFHFFVLDGQSGGSPDFLNIGGAKRIDDLLAFGFLFFELSLVLGDFLLESQLV